MNLALFFASLSCWPVLPIGLLVSLAGILLGDYYRKKERKRGPEQTES